MFHGCGGTTGTQGGSGTADLTFATGPKQWVEAKRVANQNVATISSTAGSAPRAQSGRSPGADI